MEETRNAYKIILKNPKGKHLLEDLHIDGRGVILKCVLKKHVIWGCELDSTGSGYEPVACFCEHVNGLTSSLRCGKFLNQLSHYHLLRKDYSPRR
jgi:hypothetical protein